MVGNSKQKEDIPMKNKLFQLYVKLNTIDRRYMQYAYFVLMLAMLVMNRAPEDGSGTTR